VVVIGANYVTVTIEILPILSSRTMTDVIEIQGLSQAWLATLSPAEVDVILEGPETLLTELVADDIQVYVNLFGLSRGVHRVLPVVVAPEGVSVVSVIPETIEVEIDFPPPSLPTATPMLGGSGP
jgi:YbbR domain-containing protein